MGGGLLLPRGRRLRREVGRRDLRVLEALVGAKGKG